MKIVKSTTKKTNTKKVSISKVLDITFNDGSKATKYGTIYSATEDKFSIINNNRGKIKGYDEKRVEGLMEKIENGSFIWSFATIKVIYKRKRLVILDGANRVTAVRNLILEGKLPKGYKIPFIVVNHPSLNKMTNNDLISFMADMNDYDPRWSENEHYESALSANLNTALMFDVYLRRVKSNAISSRLTYSVENSRKKSSKVRVKHNILLSLATRTPVKNNGKKVVFADFRNDEYGNYMGTTAFEKDFNALIDFLEIAKEWHVNNNIRISKSIFRALDIVYNEGVKVDFSYLVRKLKESGNKMPKNDSDLKPFLTNIVFN